MDSSPRPTHPAPQTSTLALGALAFAILGISPIAVVFGHLSLREIDRSRGLLRGRRLALAGLILGYVGTALYLVAVGVLVYSARTLE